MKSPERCKLTVGLKELRDPDKEQERLGVDLNQRQVIGS